MDNLAVEEAAVHRDVERIELAALLGHVELSVAVGAVTGGSVKYHFMKTFLTQIID